MSHVLHVNIRSDHMIELAMTITFYYTYLYNKKVPPLHVTFTRNTGIYKFSIIT